MLPLPSDHPALRVVALLCRSHKSNLIHPALVSGTEQHELVGADGSAELAAEAVEVHLRAGDALLFVDCPSKERFRCSAAAAACSAATACCSAAAARTRPVISPTAACDDQV